MCATLVASTDEIPAVGSYLLTVREPDGSLEEVILLDLEDGVSAWKNYCQHETDQRFDRGDGAATRDDQIICPKHGSMFDAETGYCDNGKAAGSTLVEVDVAVRPPATGGYLDTARESRPSREGRVFRCSVGTED